ncbi:MAG: hypothetical protein ROW48_09015 [Bellilinea sp.]|jgi:hypothetical protein
MSSTEPSLSPGERFTIALSAFLRAVLRLFILLLGGIVLAALFYFGFVLIYQQAIYPAQENAARIRWMETRQADQQEQLSQQLERFQARLIELENQQTLDKEALDSLQTSQDDLQQSLATHNQQLKALQNLEKQLAELQRAHQNTLELARANQTALESGALTRQVESDLQVLKAAVLIQRARLYLEQSNFGLAEQEMRIVRALLVELQTKAQPDQTANLAAWIGRLDSALASLPDFPVLAANDLRTVGEMLLLPDTLFALTQPSTPGQDNGASTPTPGSAATITPTPGSGLAATPTPTQTRTP